MRISKPILIVELIVGILPISLYTLSMVLSLPLLLIGFLSGDASFYLLCLFTLLVGAYGVYSLWQVFFSLYEGKEPAPELQNGLGCGMAAAALLLGILCYVGFTSPYHSGSPSLWWALAKPVTAFLVAWHWFSLFPAEEVAAS